MVATVLRDARSHRGPDRGARVERVLLRGHAFILGILTTFILLPLLTVADITTADMAARSVTAMMFTVVAVDLQLRGERVEHLVLLIPPLASVSWLASATMPTDVTPGLALSGLAVSAARVLRPPAYFAFMMVVGGSASAVQWTAGTDLTAALGSLLISVCMAYAGAGALASALETAARRATAADEQSRRRRTELVSAVADRQAVVEARRALHDDVLVALRQFDLHSDAAIIRTASQQAVDAMGRITDRIETLVSDDQDADAPIAEVVSLIQAAAPPGLTMDVRVERVASSLTLTKRVAETLVRAVGEALRNVARHSGQDRAEVVIDDNRTSLTIAVVDHGVGIPADSAAGFGMSGSIEEPVRGVGGTVGIEATPGGGVTLTITMPLDDGVAVRLPTSLANAYDLTIRATGDARWLASVAWPIGLAWLLIGVSSSFRWPTPAVSLLLLGVGYAFTIALTRHLVRRPLSTAQFWLTFATLIGFEAVALLLMPASGLLDHRSWPQGFIALPLLVLAMVLPTRATLLCLVPHPVLIVVASLLAPQLSDGAVPWGSINATLSAPLAGLVLCALLRHHGRDIEREEQELRRTSVALAAERSATRVAGLHLEHTRRVVIPWLAAVAGHRIDPSYPEVRAQADLFLHEVHDDLYSPGFVDGQLRGAASRFRARGGVLSLRPELPPEAAGGSLGAGLRRLLEDLEPGHRVTVIPAGTGANHRLSIVPGVPRHVTTKLPGHRVRDDADHTVIEFPDEPPSPDRTTPN